MVPQAPCRLAKSRLGRARLPLAAACLLLAALPLSQTLTPARSAEARLTPAPERGGETARLSEGYGRLPLWFEANRGQTDGSVKFLARGSGYTLFLAETGAVLRLHAKAAEGEGRRSGTLRLVLEGASRSPRVEGLDQLPGRGNYLRGREARAWRTGVPLFGRVRYESVYKGIDAVYYGRQGQLEYDFVVAPGADPSRIRLRFDGARSTRLEENGDLVVSTEVGDVRQQRPVAYQEFDGARREVKAVYALDAKGRVRFELGEYDRTRALVIDPVLTYSSYLGGAGADQGVAVAVDASGSAYVAGTTDSTDFPGTGSFQAAKGDFGDAFVLKLSPDGKSLVYATYLGGNGEDRAAAVALDSAGNAYVGGVTSSTNFPVTAGAFQTVREGLGDAFLSKLNPTGTGLVYSTYIGGNGGEQVNSVAVDAAGAAHVAGRTDSVNFTNAPGVARAGNPLYKSTDGGASWGASASGLTATSVNDLAAASNVVYAGASLGFYRSTDGGTSWQLGGQSNPATAPFVVRAVVVDPSDSSTVYAASSSGGVHKSTDGGVTFELKNNGLFIPIVNALVVNPSAPSTLYAGTIFGVFKTTNGGDSWSEANGTPSGATPNVARLVIDPTNPQTLYAATVNRGVLKTTDGGAGWTQVNNGLTSGFGGTLQPRALALDPTNTSTLYAGAAAPGSGVFKTTNGGASWANSSTGLTVTAGGQTFTPAVNAILIDPASASTVYAGTNGYGVFKSTDGGASWSPVNAGLANRTILALASRPGSPAALLAGAAVGSDPFVLKLNAAGSGREYMRLLGGSEHDDAVSLALGPGGSVYVTGTTLSSDFPTANARQPASAGSNEAYVVKLDSGGNTVFSTYLGGSNYEFASGVAVDASGSAYVAGTTGSTDFPVANALKSGLAEGDFQDAFVTKLSPDGQSLVYSTYLGGSSFEQTFGIAVGADGSAHLVGATTSQNFPVAGSANAFAGFQDAFLSKLSPAGSALVYSTCFGGTNSDLANAVALDGAGGIYLAGTTSSTNLPLANALRGAYGGGNTDAFVAKFGPGIDLAVTLADSPDPVAFGSDLTYTVRVKNNGDLTATGVKLNDPLPAGSTFVSAATDRGSCSGASTVVCDIGALAGGEEANVTVKIKPPAARTFNNTVTATLNETDANPANNSATVGTTVDFADLAVTKSVLSATAAPGSKVVYLLSVTNKSGTAASNVTVNDVLPAELTFVSCGSAQGVCGGTGNGRSVTFPSLAVGATGSATIVATLSASAPNGAVVGNTATASAAPPDPSTADNTASVSFTVGTPSAGAKSNGKIAFTTWEAPTTRIMVVNPDGTGLAPFTSGQNSDRKAAWSPDGSKLAYRTTTHTGSAPSPENIIVVNADGTGAKTVATDAVLNARPTWSPAGDYIAYLAWQSGSDFAVKVVSADGAVRARLFGDMEFVDGLDWSPDGTRFAFTKQGAVWVMDVDGSNRKQLTTPTQTSDGLTSDTLPDWSPDGSTILFTRSTVNGKDAYTVNADGAGLSRLLNVQQMAGASWSPDGLRVVYALGSDIYVADLDGARLPSRVAGSGLEPAWQPLPNADPTPTPTPVPTYTISGRVTKPDGGAGSAVVKLSGTRTATTSTDQNGNYSFVKLPQGGSYTVTPANGLSGQFARYAPGSRSVDNLQGNVTGLDFAFNTYTTTLRGRIADGDIPLLGVNVSVFSPFGARLETRTDFDGRYSFTFASGGEGYTVSASSQAYTFDAPGVRLADLSAGDQIVNFAGALSAFSRTLTGRVIDAHGGAIAGLPVTLGGGRSGVVKTDASGFYTFANLPGELNYTVTPSTATGFTFTPAQKVYLSTNVAQPGEFFAAFPQPVAEFAAADVSVAENARAVELTVKRTGDTSAAAAVDYETSDVTASERSDYIASHGTVRFAPGEATRTLKVLVTDDNLLEGERLFQVTLTGGSGARVGAVRTVTVHVTEEDAAASSSNPLDSSEFFVRQHYADFLNREPDAPGLAFWTGEIEGCGQDAQCREVKRVNVSAAFFLSIEFQQTGFLVYRLHQASYGSGPGLRLKTFLRDTREIGRGVVVGAAGWEEQLEANKRAFIEDFVLRPEFLARYPRTLPPAQFVDALSANTGGALSPAGREALVTGLTSGALTRAQALRAVAENAEFTRREKNRAFVLMQYFGYLRRGPADPRDSDFAGWQFWLSKLEEFDGNYIAAEMVKAFISSDEYRKRFARQ